MTSPAPLRAEAAEILEILVDEVRAAQGPWRNRERAASYLNCSESKLDKLVSAGRLKKHMGTGYPLFHKDDLDTLVKKGTCSNGSNHKSRVPHRHRGRGVRIDLAANGDGSNPGQAADMGSVL